MDPSRDRCTVSIKEPISLSLQTCREICDWKHSRRPSPRGRAACQIWPCPRRHRTASLRFVATSQMSALRSMPESSGSRRKLDQVRSLVATVRVLGRTCMLHCKLRLASVASPSAPTPYLRSCLPCVDSPTRPPHQLACSGACAGVLQPASACHVQHSFVCPMLCHAASAVSLSVAHGATRT